MKDIARAELDRHDWTSLPVMGDRSADVPAHLAATTDDEAAGHYWGLENVVVVQGQLFEAAPPVTSVLVAALSGELPETTRGYVVELLYQLVAGESDQEAVERGNPDLGAECRERARQGLWVLYRNHHGTARRTVGDILRLIEVDEQRYAALIGDRDRDR